MIKVGDLIYYKPKDVEDEWSDLAIILEKYISDLEPAREIFKVFQKGRTDFIELQTHNILLLTFL